MNTDRLHGIYLELVGLLKEKWGWLTGNSQLEFSGRSERQLEDFMRRNCNWRDLPGQ